VPEARAQKAAVVPAAVLAIAGCVALAGCGGVNAALSKQWAVVNFKPNTTAGTLAKVRAACTHVPNVVPLKTATVVGGLNATYSVRYQVDKASARNLAALQSCLMQASGDVIGVSIRDVSGTG
jgi:hypothetical protein